MNNHHKLTAGIIAALGCLIALICTAEIQVEDVNGPTVVYTNITQNTWVKILPSATNVTCSALVQNLGPATVIVRHANTNDVNGYWVAPGQNISIGGTIRVNGAIFVRTAVAGTNSYVNLIREAR